MNVSDERSTLRSLFVRATDTARAHLGDVADALDRTRRSLQQLRAGERGTSPEVVRELAAYLRDRAKRFRELAEELERAAEKEADRE